MPTVDELIQSITSGNMTGANQTFASMMQDKLNSALDDRKIEMAQSMLGIESDEDNDNEEDLEGMDDTDHDEHEEQQHDDEVQGVSD